MTKQVKYYSTYHPESLPTLFSPACGDYLPLKVHVGSSWKPIHQEYYRVLKSQFPGAVKAARELTDGLPGRVSLSRVGDCLDY